MLGVPTVATAWDDVAEKECAHAMVNTCSYLVHSYKHSYMPKYILIYTHAYLYTLMLM